MTDIRKKNSKKAVALVVGGGVLLTIGTTFALWQDSSGTGASANIDTGHISVTAGAKTVWDVSPLQLNDGTAFTAGQPISIDLDHFKAAPGDVIRVIQDVVVHVEGDNTKAELDVATDAGVSLTGTWGNEFSAEIKGIYSDMELATGNELGDLGEGDTATFTADQDGDTVYVAFDVTFNHIPDFGNDEGKSNGFGIGAELAGASVTLTQVRAE